MSALSTAVFLRKSSFVIASSNEAKRASCCAFGIKPENSFRMSSFDSVALIFGSVSRIALFAGSSAFTRLFSVLALTTAGPVVHDGGFCGAQ